MINRTAVGALRIARAYGQTDIKSIASRRFCAVSQIKQEPLEPPAADGSPKQFNDKVNAIVDQIANMTLIEIADLNAAIKQRLNLPDVSSAPMMMAAAVPAAQASSEETEDLSAGIKTDFTVRLKSFDDKQKIAIIKEVKAMLPGFNLVQAKKFVESAPVVFKENIQKDDAESIKKKLEAIGAVVEIE